MRREGRRRRIGGTGLPRFHPLRLSNEKIVVILMLLCVILHSIIIIRERLKDDPSRPCEVGSDGADAMEV